ncbi:hypothetical protein L4D76_25855 [Photobacterium sagamiensis]|uniref:hypothetical protein n=1 Tax=Photobacterium sagamiensis TaxID=2910241 RepID=UPI003D0FE49B
MINCKIHGLQETTSTNRCVCCLAEERMNVINNAREKQFKKRNETLNNKKNETASLRSFVVFNQRKKYSKSI